MITSWVSRIYALLSQALELNSYQEPVPDSNLPAWSTVANRTNIGAGTRVLDVGCGTGGFCALATQRGAHVAGIDAQPDRVDAARRRVPDGDFEVARMEQLPFTDAAFDVVTGFNSFQYALDVPAALAEAARVSRGLLAVCKYGNPFENEFFAFLAALAPERFDLSRLPARDDVDRALERFDVRERGVVATAISFDDHAALTAAVERPVGEAVAAPYRQPDGGYRFAQPLKYAIVNARPSHRPR
jgi:SAM-dependent methyltransferase